MKKGKAGQVDKFAYLLGLWDVHFTDKVDAGVIEIDGEGKQIAGTLPFCCLNLKKRGKAQPITRVILTSSRFLPIPVLTQLRYPKDNGQRMLVDRCRPWSASQLAPSKVRPVIAKASSRRLPPIPAASSNSKERYNSWREHLRRSATC